MVHQPYNHRIGRESNLPPPRSPGRVEYFGFRARIRCLIARALVPRSAGYVWCQWGGGRRGFAGGRAACVGACLPNVCRGTYRRRSAPVSVYPSSTGHQSRKEDPEVRVWIMINMYTFKLMSSWAMGPCICKILWHDMELISIPGRG